MTTLLSPREVAAAIGASESSVKRWVDDGRIRAARTVGGHRRIAIEEAVGFVRREGLELVRPELLGLRLWDEDPGDDRDESLYRLLESGLETEATGLILSAYLAGESPARLVDGPIAGSMRRIGTLWREERDGIFKEHRATRIVVAALHRLRSLCRPASDAPLAIGGAPEGDIYAIPSLAAALVAENAGLRAVDLGPQTPLETLGDGAIRLSARLVWLSVSVAESPDLEGEVGALATRLERAGAALIVGGCAAETLALKGGAFQRGRTMAELEALARGVAVGAERKRQIRSGGESVDPPESRARDSRAR